MPAADELDRRLRAAAGPAPDAEVALAALADRLARPADRRPQPQRALAIAAVLVLVVGAAWTATRWRSDDGPSVRTGPTTTVPAPTGPVDFRVLSVAQADDQRISDLRSAATTAELADLWADAGTTDPTPTIDLDRDAVVSITIADDACPPDLASFGRDGTTLTPDFVEPPEACEQPLIARTYVVALSWASTGDPFVVSLPDQTNDDETGPTRLEVTRAETPPLDARIVLPSRTIAGGATVEGTVEVHNGTGRQIEGTICGPPFGVWLSSDTIDQVYVQAACAAPFLLPTGESSYPFTLEAAQSCSTDGALPGDGTIPPIAACEPDGSPPPLPPGTYATNLASPALATPIPDPEPLTITIT